MTAGSIAGTFQMVVQASPENILLPSLVESGVAKACTLLASRSCFCSRVLCLSKQQTRKVSAGHGFADVRRRRRQRRRRRRRRCCYRPVFVVCGICGPT